VADLSSEKNAEEEKQPDENDQKNRQNHCHQATDVGP
jgi:hypothetical protein